MIHKILRNEKNQKELQKNLDLANLTVFYILDIRPPTRPPPGGQLTITVQQQDVSTVFGNTVQLSCYISSTPQGKSSSDYNLYWRKQNGNISFGKEILVNLD